MMPPPTTAKRYPLTGFSPG